MKITAHKWLGLTVVMLMLATALFGCQPATTPTAPPPLRNRR